MIKITQTKELECQLPSVETWRCHQTIISLGESMVRNRFLMPSIRGNLLINACYSLVTHIMFKKKFK